MIVCPICWRNEKREPATYSVRTTGGSVGYFCFGHATEQKKRYGGQRRRIADA